MVRIILFILSCVYFFVIVYMLLHIYCIVDPEVPERNAGATKGKALRDKTETSNDDFKYVQHGPGANGSPLKFKKFSDEATSLKVSEAKDKHDYNAVVSDFIPLQRILPDSRPEVCLVLRYPDDLPPVSVVIPFRNERPSVLLRTVYSVLLHSPARLLREIILVDDGSNEPDLGSQLDVHVASLPKVRLIRKAVNVGLMMARQAGIDASSADYFITMDSHMECSPGWLEPVVYRLVQKPKALVCSNIGSINNDDFGVSPNTEKFGVAFDFPFFTWNLGQQIARFTKEYSESRKNNTEPMWIGTVMGMIIAMRKDWFQQLGGFDPGMHIWGSEQIELSVKVWMCGGEVEMVPCSILAHIYRRVMWSVGKVGMVNLFRVAYTWLDQPYRQVVIDYSGEKPSEVDVGDVSERRALREANACHSFQYFVDKVKSFASIHDPAQSRWIGSLKNNGNSMCLEASYPLEEKVGHSNCHGRGYNQLFEWTGKSELRHLGHCLYVLPGGRVIMKHCDHFEDPSHKTWVFDEAPGSVLHVQSNTCLTMDKKSVVATKCNQTPEQRWRVVPVSVTS